MPLSDTAIRNAKPSFTPKGITTDKPYKMGDSAGLYLEVAHSGGKWWWLKYRFEGKEKRLSLGVYPDVSLKDARERRDEARKLLANGVDPGENRKAAKAAKIEFQANSFEVIAREWLARMKTEWAYSHYYKVTLRLENDVFPWIGHKPITEVTAPVRLFRDDSEWHSSNQHIINPHV